MVWKWSETYVLWIVASELHLFTCIPKGCWSHTGFPEPVSVMMDWVSWWWLRESWCDCRCPHYKGNLWKVYFTVYYIKMMVWGFFLMPEKHFIWPVDLNGNNQIVLIQSSSSSQCVNTVPGKQWAVVVIRKANKKLLVAVKMQQIANDKLQMSTHVSLRSSVKLCRVWEGPLACRLWGIRWVCTH